ncbi:CoxG family protein [Acidimangrovimonas sediminis]|uniref:CoxG family protein n=1 Tax=Acidimangrovimonas sediminis TaxID=2056283 RepID=UPI000C80C739|nr:carbon monoxide dehydrogenase subunit G [Acidimangrovimonas sediminis]
MELTNTQVIAAPREDVWAAINDPEVLKRCIPGCEEVTRTSDEEMDAKITLKVGPVKASFTGKVIYENVVKPESLTLSGQGSGGVAGSAKGSANVTLKEVPEGTELSYEVNVAISGKIAQLGSRLINSTAKKLTGQFFDNLEKEFESEEG